MSKEWVLAKCLGDSVTWDPAWPILLRCQEASREFLSLMLQKVAETDLLQNAIEPWVFVQPGGTRDEEEIKEIRVPFLHGPVQRSKSLVHLPHSCVGIGQPEP